MFNVRDEDKISFFKCIFIYSSTVGGKDCCFSGALFLCHCVKVSCLGIIYGCEAQTSKCKCLSLAPKLHDTPRTSRELSALQGVAL